MGGRGASSQSNKQFYANFRVALRTYAEQIESLGYKSARNRYLAETARAGEALVGTDRARDLLKNQSLKALETELLRAYATIRTTVIADIEDAVAAAAVNKPINRPLGSGMTGTEWLATAEAIQDYKGYLNGYGYTDAEIAAGLVYGKSLWNG